MHLILGWSSFCTNYCFNVAWHAGDQPVALLLGFGSGELAGQSSSVISWLVNTLEVGLALCKSPARKGNQHLHKACQQIEA